MKRTKILSAALDRGAVRAETYTPKASALLMLAQRRTVTPMGDRRTKRGGRGVERRRAVHEGLP